MSKKKRNYKKKITNVSPKKITHTVTTNKLPGKPVEGIKKIPKRITASMTFNKRIESEQPKRVYLKVKQVINKLKKRMETGWCIITPVTINRTTTKDLLTYDFSADVIHLGKKKAINNHYNLSGKSELILIGFEEKMINKVFKSGDALSELDVK